MFRYIATAGRVGSAYSLKGVSVRGEGMGRSRVPSRHSSGAAGGRAGCSPVLFLLPVRWTCPSTPYTALGGCARERGGWTDTRGSCGSVRVGAIPKAKEIQEKMNP